MSETLFQISATQRTQEFFDYAEKLGHRFNYNIFRRTKNRSGKRLTDRQLLLLTIADQYLKSSNQGQHSNNGLPG